MKELLEGAGKTFRLLVVPDKNIAYSQHVPARDLRASCAPANNLALRDAIGGFEPGYSSVAARAATGLTCITRATSIGTCGVRWSR